MPTRRPRTTISIEDVTGEIDEVMEYLISRKNDNQSFTMIADNLSTERLKISPALVRLVALGRCKSPKIEMALGLRELELTVPVSMVRKTKRRKAPAKRRGRFIIEDRYGVLAVNIDARRGEMSRYDYQLCMLDVMIQIESIMEQTGLNRDDMMEWLTGFADDVGEVV